MSVVHGSVSAQSPSNWQHHGMRAMPQAPVLASHESTVQELPSLQSVADAQQPCTACVVQVPALQVPVMQAEGLVQSVLVWQQPVTGLELHAPALQASVVHGLPSSQSAGDAQQAAIVACTH